jgi:hypothetical protein
MSPSCSPSRSAAQLEWGGARVRRIGAPHLQDGPDQKRQEHHEQHHERHADPEIEPVGQHRIDDRKVLTELGNRRQTYGHQEQISGQHQARLRPIVFGEDSAFWRTRSSRDGVHGQRKQDQGHEAVNDEVENSEHGVPPADAADRRPTSQMCA